MDNQLNNVLEKVKSASGFEDAKFTDINELNLLNENALHYVATWGDVEAAKTLIKAGININQKGDEGYTPLHEAILQGNNDLAIYLINNGAKTEIKNNDGLTPLELAIQEQNKLVTKAIKQHNKSFKPTPKSGAV